MSAIFAADMLRAYVDRIERLDEEAKALSSDKSEVYQEAKGNGFDVKALKEIIRLRRKDGAELAEFESIVDLYKHALGMASEGVTRARVETIDEFPSAIRPEANAVASSGSTGESANTQSESRRVRTSDVAPVASDAAERKQADRSALAPIHNEGGASQAAEHDDIRKLDAPETEAAIGSGIGPGPVAVDAYSADELEIPTFLKRVA